MLLPYRARVSLAIFALAFLAAPLTACAGAGDPPPAIPTETPTEDPVTTPHFFGIAPGMTRDDCMAVARDRHEIGETEDGIVAVTGTYANQPVQMRWNFHDDALVLVDAEFTGFSVLKALAVTPMYAEIVATLGEPTEAGQEGNKAFAHWSAGDVRVRLMSHSKSVKGRGQVADYSMQVFSASHYGAE